jgi:alpha-D-ribose 1-methylphosphonate 5-triphosphate synthase subunit PhnL
LLKCIFRTYRADAGSVTWTRADGSEIDVVQATDDEVLDIRRDEVGYVSQFLRPMPRVTAIDLAARPLVERGIGRAEARERIADLFARVHLPRELWDGLPILFSGGEQQRVNLVRGLAVAPRLLLLDEPTASLSPDLQSEVVTLIGEARDRGTTLVGVMHDTDLLNRLSDQVIVLDRGRRVA